MPPLPTTSDLLRLYGIKAKKKLSQNFILDPRILQRFVKIGGDFSVIFSGVNISQKAGRLLPE